MWWTAVINKNWLPSRIIFWQWSLSTHLTSTFLMWDVPCTRSEVCMVLIPHIKCSMSGGRGGREGTSRVVLCPPNPNVEGCSPTNQHGHGHQNTDQPNSRRDGCGRVWAQGSSDWYFSSFQPFLAQVFPKTDVVSVHLSCINFFRVC